MSPINSGVLTAIIVVIGRWARGQSLAIGDALAAGFMILFLIAMEYVDRELARMMGVLVVVAVSFIYLVGDDGEPGILDILDR